MGAGTGPVSLETVLNNSFWGNSDRIAVFRGETTVTYQQFGSDIYSRGRILLEIVTDGIPKGKASPIGISMTDPYELVVTLLGCISKRIPYIILDFGMPAERLAYMVADSGVRLCVTDDNNATLECYPDLRFVKTQSQQQEGNLTVDLFECHGSEDLAYLIYTSGSTGIPKGIAHTWMEVSDNILWMHNAFSKTAPNPNVLQLIPAYSDPSLRQLLWPLTSGGSITLLNPATRHQIDTWLNVMLATGTTDLFIVPNLLQAFLDYAVNLHENVTKLALQRVFSVGEPLLVRTAQVLSTLFPKVELYNQYGVSEISGNLTNHRFDHCRDSNSKYVPIGAILNHIEFHVLNDRHEILACKPGVKGTLAVRGRGMQSAYVNGREPERFMSLPAGNSKSLMFFHTGDVFGACDEELRLQFQGRGDHQVKILGHRVELLEIEGVLSSYQGVQKCAVVFKTDLDPPLLLGYIQVQKERFVDDQDLKAFLRQFLPSFMVPTKIIPMGDFPQLPNGKIDRMALQSLDISDGALNPAKAIQMPALSKTEQRVTAIYEKVFKNVRISLASNFFELGGNSLLCFQLTQLLMLEFHVQITIATLINNPVVKDISAAIDNLLAGSSNLVPKSRDIRDYLVEDGGKCKLEPLQLSYLLSTADSETQAPIHDYLELFCVKFHPVELESSLNLVISRHPMLRTVVVDQQFQQTLERWPKYGIQTYDLSSKTAEEVKNHLQLIRTEQSHQKFDLTRFPSFDIRLSQTNSGDFLHLSFDGLFVDASSFAIILREWSALYRKPTLELPPIQLTFTQYSNYKSETRNQALCESDRQFWLKKLPSFPSGPELPFITRSDKIPKFSRESDAIPIQIWRDLQALGEANRLSNNSILLTAFATVIARFSSSKRFGLNLTLDNRIPIHPDVEHLVGNFTSTLIQEFTEEMLIIGGSDFLQNAGKVQESLEQGLDHRLFSGIDVQREIISQLGVAKDNLFPVVFTNLLKIDRDYRTLFNGGNTQTTYHITQTPQVVLDCKVYEDQRGLVLEWDYSENAFPPGLVKTMHNLYVSCINCLANQELDIKADQLLPPGHMELVKGVNSTICSFDLCFLDELFFKSVQHRKNEPAVLTSTSVLTYSELSQRVIQVSHQIVSNGKTAFVGILLEKGWKQVVAVLAVLSVGASYVPLDPSWPSSRIESIIQQCDIRKVITSFGVKCVVGLNNLVDYVLMEDSNVKVCCDLKLPPISNRNIDDTAYVIFTSGSTGTPKGVAVSHRSVVNTILYMNQRCEILFSDRVLGLSELHFDLSVYDIFGILAAGGGLVLPEADFKREPSAWVDLIQKHKVTLWNTVPALLQMLTDYVSLNPTDLQIRWAWLSGDRIPLTLPDAFRRFAKSCEILSLGGATEAAIWSISYPIREMHSDWITIPYGKPLANQRFYVLDGMLEICPVWVKGELFIGGVGLALGYFGDEVKTNFSFFIHPETNERLYRTGDYGRYLPDGNIEFMGRQDDQIKINGNRIELDEIKSALLKHHLVSDAMVTLDVKDLSQILGFVTSEYLEYSTNSSESADFLYNFKKSQPGLRPIAPIEERIVLEPRNQSEFEYWNRKSYRSFESGNVTKEEIFKFLNEITQPVNIRNQNAKLDLRSLGQVLSQLSHLRDSSSASDFPKYLYASAGNLYPVQVYLVVGNSGINGLKSGYYYYDPLIHQLVLINTLNSEERGNKLILVGRYSALNLVYKSTSESLMWLNTGYLLGALSQSSTVWDNLTIYSHHSKNEMVNKLSLAKHDKILLSLDICSNGKYLETLLPQGKIYANLKTKGARTSTHWLQYPEEQPKNQKSFKLTVKGESALIYGEASVSLFFVDEIGGDFKTARIQSGFWAHKIMTHGVSFQLGFCPIGNLDEVCQLDRPVIHGLFGGKVSTAQIQALQSSELVNYRDPNFIAESITNFSKTQLPSYMIPAGILSLSTWPLTSNGKVDKGALQTLCTKLKSPTLNEKASTRDDGVAEFLLTITKNVLGIEHCNLFDNFLRLGGNSIAAVKLMSRLRFRFAIDIDVKDVLQNPKLSKLLGVLKSKILTTSGILLNPIKKHELADSDTVPLTRSQKGLFFLHIMNPTSYEYNIPVVVKLKGDIRFEVISRAFDALIARHSALRSNIFINQDGNPVQRINRESECQSSFQIKDIKTEDLSDAINCEIAEPFNLSETPLCRASILRTAEDESILVFVQHHIISDGWSVSILADDLSKLYNELLEDKQTKNSYAADLQFYDFAIWETEIQQPSNHSAFIDYWKIKLADFETLQLPIQKTRPRVFTSRGKEFRFTLDSSLSRKLNDVALENDTTLYCVLLATSFSLLSRYSGQTDICIGSPVSSRHLPELESIVGFFVNTVVHRAKLPDETCFVSLLKQVSDSVISSIQHQRCPLESVVESLGVERDPGKNPIFQVMMALQNIHSNFELKLSNVEAVEMNWETNTAKFDLSMIFKEDQGRGQIHCVFEYYADIFSKAFITQLADSFCHHAQSVCESPTVELNALPLWSPKESERLVGLINKDHSSNPAKIKMSIPDLIHIQMVNRKHSAALQDANRSITYGQLDILTESIAYNIQQLEGVEKVQFIPIYSTDKFKSICLMLGVLRAGKTYVIMDSELPTGRIQNILADISASIIISDLSTTNTKIEELCSNQLIISYDCLTILNSGQNWNPPISNADDICTVIYTSGTTGTPKGVLIPHRAITRLITNTDYIKFYSTDVVSQIAQLSFDASNFEIFGALLSGAKLLIIPRDDLLDTDKFKSVIQNHGVSVMLMVTSLFNTKIEVSPEVFSNLRVLLIGGEEPCVRFVKKLFENPAKPTAILNAYGPTENGTISTTQEIDLRILAQDFIPIGKPISNSTCFVLDKNFNLVPSFVVGELYVGGLGLASGYLNKDKEFRNKFIHCKINSNEEFLYKTGDLVSIVEDGSLRFHQRRDDQVKIRGYRIEIMEVQQLLLKLDAVLDCAVMSKKECNDAYLIAYVVLAKDYPTSVIFDEVEKQLPNYMIPQKFGFVETIPLTLNGKVDFTNLASIVKSQQYLLRKSCDSETTEVENWLLDLWRSELNMSAITVTDNFFSLGGHSLKAITILHKINQAWNVQIPMAEFFSSPTISNVYHFIKSSSNISARTTNFTIDLAGRYEPFALVEMQQAYLIGREISSEISSHCYFELKFKSLDIPRLNHSLSKLIHRHEMLRCVVTADMQQKIIQNVPEFIIPVSQLASNDFMNQVLKTRAEMSHQTLDFYNFPTFDIRLTKSPTEDIMHLSFDGMFMDALSLDIFFREWSYLYNNPNDDLPALEFSFRDYVNYLEMQKESKEYQEAKEYFMNRVEGFPTGPQIPKNLAEKTNNLERKFVSLVSRIPRLAWTNLKELATLNEISPTCILLSLFADVVGKFSENSHFALNLTLFNRIPVHPQVSTAIGEFTTTNLLECDVSKSVSFIERCKKVQDQLYSDLDHKSFSTLEFQRHISKNLVGSLAEGLYPVVFTSMLNIDRCDRSGLFNYQFLETSFCITQTPQVYIDCKVYEDSGHLVIEWDYLNGVLPPEFVSTMHKVYSNSVHYLSNHNLELPTCKLVQNELLDLILRTNDTEIEWQYCDLYTAILNKCRGRSNDTAIALETREISYEELFKMVGNLRRRMLIERVSDHGLVAVILKKGWEQVIAVLSILSIGLGYVPLDPDWPEGRIQSILKQCEVSLILTTGDLLTKLQFGDSIKLITVDNEILDKDCEDKFESICTSVDSIAYILFTSGSTGTPKGVAVTHKSVLNTLLDMNQRCQICETDRVLALSELHFDLSVYDIFGILIAGGCLVLPDHLTKRNPLAWLNLITKYNVTLWNSVPALLQVFTEYLGLNSNREVEITSIRWAWLSGDHIPLALPDAFRKFVKSCEILSLGGATEAAIWSICYPVEEIKPEWTTIPYGKPLANQRFYVLDKKLEICPVWVKGELYIGGMGLASGYFGDEVKTKLSFFNHPVTGERLYKTGDFGRYLPDGNIEFMGRQDDQIKINGNRIELDEIKSALQKHYLVSDAIVTLDKDQSQIIGFVISEYLEFSPHSSGSWDFLYNFKKSQPGLRPIYHNEERIVLEPRTQNEEEYWGRKSYRSFDSECITKDSIFELLSDVTSSCNIDCQNVKLDLSTLGRLLLPLSQLRNNPTDFPKYMYASAGNLYPIQVYLTVGNSDIDGLNPGHYYYDPLLHQLVLINKLDSQYSATKMLLVGRYSALNSIYKSISESLMWLNAGYLLGALSKNSITFTHLKVLGDNHDGRIVQKLGLADDDKLLLSLEISSNGDYLDKLVPRGTIYANFKTKGSRASNHWLQYLIDKPDADFSKRQTSFKMDLKEDSKIIHGESSLEIFFTAERGGDSKIDRLQSGFWAQRIMANGAKSHLGFCPIGNLDEVCQFDRPVIHGLFGGKISTGQIQSQQPSKLVNYRDPSFISESIIAYSKTQLPSYMIPAGILSLPTWPLTANGKIDRAALKDELGSELISNASADLRATPFTLAESKLLGLWQTVLGFCVPLNTEFFKTSGNSLDALKLALLINESFGANINVAWVYKHQTITEQAKMLETNCADNAQAHSSYIIFNKSGRKRPIILIHPGRDSAFAYSQLSHELGEDQPIVALEYHNLFAEAGDLDQTVEDIGLRYVKTLVSLKTLSPPYILGGWSFGGLVAFEIARQLQNMGESVKSILMFDTPFPIKDDSSEIEYDPDLDILGMISEPEKHLYKTLSEKGQEKYRTAAIVELKAIQKYSLTPTRKADFGCLQIIQFLPENNSNQGEYLRWDSFCAELVIHRTPGDHGSLLRNHEDRQCLVAGIQKYTAPKLIFVFAGAFFEYGNLADLLPGHHLVALVRQDNLKSFAEKFSPQFSKVIGITGTESIGYLNQLDFSECYNIIKEELPNFEVPPENTYIISSDEGNVSLAAKLRESFSLPTGPGPNQVLKFRDKTAMKSVLKEEQIKVPTYVKLNSQNAPNIDFKVLEAQLKTPFIIKPTNSGGGFEVYKVENLGQFESISKSLNLALEYEAEEFLTGELYHCDLAFEANQQNPVFDDCALYFHPFMGYESKHHVIGSSNAVDPKIRGKIISFCTKAVKILGGNSGVFHCEVFRDPKTGVLTFLELGSRVPGALIPKMYKKTHKVNLHELDILLQVGETCPEFKLERGKFGVWGIYFSHSSGEVVKINEIEKNLKLEQAQVDLFYKEGDYYDTEKSMHNVTGTIVFASEGFEKVREACGKMKLLELMEIK